MIVEVEGTFVNVFTEGLYGVLGRLVYAGARTSRARASGRRHLRHRPLPLIQGVRIGGWGRCEMIVPPLIQDVRIKGG